MTIELAIQGLRENGIETAIWEPVPDNPCHVRVKHGRPAGDVFDEFRKKMSAAGFKVDGVFYWLRHASGDIFKSWRGEACPTKVSRIACYVYPGGNEGYMLHIDFVLRDGSMVPFAVGKVLDGKDEAWRAAIAASELFSCDPG